MDALIYSFIGLGLVFVFTLVGALAVFFVKRKFSNKLSSIILALSGGVLVGAAIFCLFRDALFDSFDYLSTFLGILVIVAICIFGFVFMLIFDKSVDKLSDHRFKTLNKESSKVLFAIILHNIPEGLSLGVIFGILFTSPTSSAVSGALSLAIILAVHNFIQSLTTSLTFLDLGISKIKSFFYMVIAGIFELGFAVLGIVLSSNVIVIIPWLMALASGVMLYVGVIELMNDSLEKNERVYSYIFFFIGVLIMFALEILI